MSCSTPVGGNLGLGSDHKQAAGRVREQFIIDTVMKEMTQVRMRRIARDDDVRFPCASDIEDFLRRITHAQNAFRHQVGGQIGGQQLQALASQILVLVHAGAPKPGKLRWKPIGIIDDMNDRQPGFAVLSQFSGKTQRTPGVVTAVDGYQNPLKWRYTNRGWIEGPEFSGGCLRHGRLPNGSPAGAWRRDSMLPPLEGRVAGMAIARFTPPRSPPPPIRQRCM